MWCLDHDVGTHCNASYIDFNPHPVNNCLLLPQPSSDIILPLKVLDEHV